MSNDPGSFAEAIMLVRFIRRILRPAVMADADRLILGHGNGAVYLARHAVNAAREIDHVSHWSRVLAEIERRFR